MNMSIPDPKAPPREYRERAKAERARRKACHGSWAACQYVHAVTPDSTDNERP